MAPRKATATCDTTYGASFANSPDSTAKPKVTAGLMCASGLPHAIATNTPAITANAQPLVMTIQPASSAFERLSKTFATTPSPNSIDTSVPMNSPKHFASTQIPPPPIQTRQLVDPIERAGHGSLPKVVELIALSIRQVGFPGVVDLP